MRMCWTWCDRIPPDDRAMTEDALRRLDHVRPGGSTALGAGWLRGAEQVAAGMRPDGVDRTILLTDGQANVGITDPAELAHHAAEQIGRAHV